MRIAGVARLNRIHRRNEAEFAIVVADEWQRRGLGTRLMEKLVEIGRREKLDVIEGSVLRENFAMLRICQRFGFKQHIPEASETVVVRRSL